MNSLTLLNHKIDNSFFMLIKKRENSTLCKMKINSQRMISSSVVFYEGKSRNVRFGSKWNKSGHFSYQISPLI